MQLMEQIAKEILIIKLIESIVALLLDSIILLISSLRKGVSIPLII